MIQNIKAKNLASGDIVYFPRVGKRKVVRLAADHSSIGIRSVFFDDCKTRSLQNNSFVKAEITTAVPELRAGELYRLDTESLRISIISSGAFMRGFSDVQENFKQLPARVRTPTESILLTEMERGTVFHTDSAVYSMNLEKIQQLLK